MCQHAAFGPEPSNDEESALNNQEDGTSMDASEYDPADFMRAHFEEAMDLEVM